MDDKNNDYLEHYASKYYDPVKAHEYYMRTRELKGRKSSAASKSKGKRKRSRPYTKRRTKTAKKRSINLKKAKTSVKNITRKLDVLKQKLSEEAKNAKRANNKPIREQVDADPLMNLSAGKPQTGKLNEEKGEWHWGQSGKIAEQKVKTKLKAAISATWSCLGSLFSGKPISYEEAYQTEYDKVKEEFKHENAKPKK